LASDSDWGQLWDSFWRVNAEEHFGIFDSRVSTFMFCYLRLRKSDPGSYLAVSSQPRQNRLDKWVPIEKAQVLFTDSQRMEGGNMEQYPSSRKSDLVLQTTGKETLIYDLKPTKAICLDKPRMLILR